MTMLSVTVISNCYQYVEPHFEMPDYKEGEISLTIKIQETFVVDIEQNSEISELITAIRTVESDLVNRLELQRFGERRNFVWEDHITIGYGGYSCSIF